MGYCCKDRTNYTMVIYPQMTTLVRKTTIHFGFWGVTLLYTWNKTCVFVFVFFFHGGRVLFLFQPLRCHRSKKPPRCRAEHLLYHLSALSNVRAWSQDIKSPCSRFSSRKCFQCFTWNCKVCDKRWSQLSALSSSIEWNHHARMLHLKALTHTIHTICTVSR